MMRGGRDGAHGPRLPLYNGLRWPLFAPLAMMMLSLGTYRGIVFICRQGHISPFAPPTDAENFLPRRKYAYLIMRHELCSGAMLI